MSSDSIFVPNRLPVLPLPYPLILHPSLLLSIPLSYAHSLSLLKAALQVSQPNSSQSNGGNGRRDQIDAHKPIIVACVPTLRPDLSNATSQAPPANAIKIDDDVEELGTGSKEEADLRVKINDLYDWGCAARLIRLTRHPASQTCTLVVTGIARVRVDRWLSVRAPLTSTTLDSARNLTVPDVPVPLASMTTFPETPFPGRNPSTQDQEAVKKLRIAATELIEALMNDPTSRRLDAADPRATALSLPLLPNALLKRLMSFVREARDSQSGLLADVLVGTLGGACAWNDRVGVLGEYDPRERVARTITLLGEGVYRVRTARELIAALGAPLSSGSKESLAKNQLEGLLAQLAALNPNISARISTGNTTFSIGSVKKGSEDDGKVGGIIAIRGNNNTKNDDASQSAVIRPVNAPLKPFRANPFGSSRGMGGGGAGGAEGANEEDEDEVAELTRKLDEAKLTPEARKVCDRELKRLGRIPAQSVERGVVITYLETMAELPWDKTSTDMDTKAITTGEVDEGIVSRARRILDEDHYGLDKIKRRLVEYLAVLELKTEQAKERMSQEERDSRETAKAGGRKGDAGNGAPESQSKEVVPWVPGLGEDGPGIDRLDEQAEDEAERKRQRDEQVRRRKNAFVADKGPILLLVGPPGTGKTSIAKSLAAALKRPFTRLSLGGVRDESEIRGHRRTYVGAMPGNIASSLRKVGVSDPVILLDEIDKLSSGNGLHGDPMAAMLEVLDPEQNNQFSDHYINCPMDLSRVLFIATANTLETISPPLLDRTEVIQVSGYTHDEKVAIAKQYLLPKQAKAQGLSFGKDLIVGDDVLLKIAMSYTREAGVRSLEREIGAVARAKAVQFAEDRKGTLKDSKGNKCAYDPKVRVEDLLDILGIESYEPEVADIQSRSGVSTGLAYQGSGSGGILHIETLMLPPGTGNMKLTGKLGDVIQESANLAFSWVKAHAFQLGIVPNRESEFPKNDVHLHMPSGAIPKDGPSAGVAMVCALVSLWTDTVIPKELAMTGEITLRGLVTPVGGIKEKCLGAHRAGIKRLILPMRNRKDVESDLPQNVRSDLDIQYVRTIWQAIDIAFGNALYENALMRNGSLEGIDEGRRLMTSEFESSRL
ncbi:ATP-dependent protease La [Meira miltonrushii]|uniref:Lon protease homolog n=1 Tax=Meira miltonrushii TaxID=1280837 RepID=A0A316VFP3_9BASI|nr:ATP-dependent protease La [Meira miltonrushii]PWN35133.1 ATP-dependent protease La [Meira miltonrushii]